MLAPFWMQIIRRANSTIIFLRNFILMEIDFKKYRNKIKAKYF